MVKSAKIVSVSLCGNFSSVPDSAYLSNQNKQDINPKTMITHSQIRNRTVKTVCWKLSLGMKHRGITLGFWVHTTSQINKYPNKFLENYEILVLIKFLNKHSSPLDIEHALRVQ